MHTNAMPMLNVTESVAITDKGFENMSSEKPYSCKYCFKEYKKLEKLKYHELIHTGEKPKSCKYCSKKSGIRSYTSLKAKQKGEKGKPEK